VGQSKRGRRQARILAVQALYQMEMVGVSATQAVRTAARLTSRSNPTEAEEVESATGYAEEIVEAATRQRATIEDLIRSAGSQWRIDRMAPLDLQVLRVGVAELLAARPDVPAPVSIDEAVEIAKAFGGESSGSFINGVLDAVARRLPAGAGLRGHGSAEGSGR
jgi:N utilization substance protein B